MTTKSKFSCPVLGRVAMTLLMMVCVLLPCTAGVVHTIDLNSDTNDFQFVAGTVTKDNGKLYVTANAGYHLHNFRNKLRIRYLNLSFIPYSSCSPLYSSFRSFHPNPLICNDFSAFLLFCYLMAGLFSTSHRFMDNKCPTLSD